MNINLNIILFCIHTNESLGWFLLRNHPNTVLASYVHLHCRIPAEIHRPLLLYGWPPHIRQIDTRGPIGTAVRLMQSNDRGRALQKICKVQNLPWGWDERHKAKLIPQSANVLVHVSLSKSRKQQRQCVSKQMTTWKLKNTWPDRLFLMKTLIFLTHCKLWSDQKNGLLIF